MIRLLNPGVFAVTTTCVGLAGKESTADGLLTYTRLRRLTLLIKIDRPTSTCSVRLDDLVELLNSVVTSGKVTVCPALTYAPVGAAAAGIVGGAWA
jgi:hypothetical protein